MATTSAARIAANRQNAQKSSGPRTPEGKARARANAVKHGLTGAGIALPTEDAAVVERRFVDLQIELAPATLAASLLVRQVALMSVRIDRAALQEAAALAQATRHAAIEFDLARASEIDRLFHTIETNPAENRRRLLTTPEGTTRLIDALQSVRDQLETAAHRSWSLPVRQKVDAFLGGAWADFPVARSEALLHALRGCFVYIPPDEIAAIPKKAARIEWARRSLIDLVDLERAHLIAARASLDTAFPDADRREAAHRALFDPSPEASLARKYEAAATRAFNRALRDLRELPTPFNSAADPEPNPESESNSSPSREHNPPDLAMVDPADEINRDESDDQTDEGNPTHDEDADPIPGEIAAPTPLAPVQSLAPARTGLTRKLPNEPNRQLPDEPIEPVTPVDVGDVRTYGIPVYHPPNLGY